MHGEIDNVAILLATEAVKGIRFGVNVETRMLLLMEWAEGRKLVAASAEKESVLGDFVNGVLSRIFDRFLIVVSHEVLRMENVEDSSQSGDVSIAFLKVGK